KQAAKAVQRVQAQIAKGAERADLQYLLAESLIADHKTAEAESALKRTIELDKSAVPAYLLLAQLESAGGRTDEATSTLERSVRENPRDVRAYVDEGVYEERRGNWQRAEELYKKTLQIQPKQADAANNLSFLLL